MSRPTPPIQWPSASVPRASGDEPVTKGYEDSEAVCSPRERG